MKVQLQTNYVNRNSTQRTNKAENFAKPNFAGTGQVAVRLVEGVNASLLDKAASLFQRHNHTALIKGTDIQDGCHFVKASFTPDKDAKVLASMSKLLEELEQAGENKFVFDYTTGQHGLTKEELSNMKFEQTFGPEKTVDPSKDIIIRRSSLLED